MQAYHKHKGKAKFPGVVLQLAPQNVPPPMSMVAYGSPESYRFTHSACTPNRPPTNVSSRLDFPTPQHQVGPTPYYTTTAYAAADTDLRYTRQYCAGSLQQNPTTSNYIDASIIQTVPTTGCSSASVPPVWSTSHNPRNHFPAQPTRNCERRLNGVKPNVVLTTQPQPVDMVPPNMCQEVSVPVNLEKSNRKSYQGLWKLKLFFLAIPTLVFLFVFFGVLSLGFAVGFFILLFVLHALDIGTFLISRLKNTKYNCPCSIRNRTVDQTISDVIMDMPTPSEKDKWAVDTDQYIKPLLQHLQEDTGITFRYVASGSSAEGFGIPYNRKRNETCCCCFPYYEGRDLSLLATDHDIMLVPDGVTVLEAGLLSDASVVVEGVPGHPGYVYPIPLRTSTFPFPKTLSWNASRGALGISSVVVRNQVMSSLDHVHIKKFPSGNLCGRFSCDCSMAYICCGLELHNKHKGPAIKMKLALDPYPWWVVLLNWTCFVLPLPLFCVLRSDWHTVRFEGDFIMALYCPSWPNLAVPWLTRQSVWPSKDVKKKIAANGCHIVPKSFITGVGTFEWRWSFSLAEVSLSNEIPLAAKQALLCLKVLHKDSLCAISGHLKSYHLKTILYWTLEKQEFSFWSTKRHHECLVLLIDETISYVDKRLCPNYWIPEINLFADMPEIEAVNVINTLLSIKDNLALHLSPRCEKRCLGPTMRYIQHGPCRFVATILFTMVVWITFVIFVYIVFPSPGWNSGFNHCNNTLHNETCNATWI